MTEISIKVEGLERLEKKLGKLVTAKRLLPSMQEAVKDVQRDMMVRAAFVPRMFRRPIAWSAYP